MADIFISYSSKDHAQAVQLTELLSSAGLSVWIDREGIDVATSWSKEIVDGINGCKALVLLLSSTSVVSHNVIKEVSLASQKRKKIVPLDLEPVTIPPELEYQLAGIQRTSMSNIDAIIRALGKIGLEATQAPTIKLVNETDSRKSLMILPFEDLSPTGDNGWFADGIAMELISALSKVTSLKVTDQQRTKEFKKYNGHLTMYAKEMSIRYFIQGSVRKFGDQIKITSSLLDIETGDNLWQDSMKGTMDDIFDIQEKVAEKVVEGLKIHLASDELIKLTERGTDNVEAYELYLKADEYFARNTKEGHQLAIGLLTEAIRLDSNYAEAYYSKANALAGIYSRYDRTPALLDEVETLSKEALRLKPELYVAYSPLSNMFMLRGQLAEAEEMGKEFIRKDPLNYRSHFALGFFYHHTGQHAKAIAPYEEAVRLNPDNLVSLFNLVVSCDAAEEHDKSRHWAEVALPYYVRHVRLHPDDEGKRVLHALLLQMSGRVDDAHAAAQKLSDLRDGSSLYNTACLFGKLGDRPAALRSLHNAIKAGFINTRLLKEFLTDEKDGLARLANTTEYKEVEQMVEQIEQEAASHG